MSQLSIDGNINWKDLRKQKQTLLSAIRIFETKDMKEAAEDLEGILNLIDNIQDSAVKHGLKTEEEVFNLSKELKHGKLQKHKKGSY